MFNTNDFSFSLFRIIVPPNWYSRDLHCLLPILLCIVVLTNTSNSASLFFLLLSDVFYSNQMPPSPLSFSFPPSHSLAIGVDQSNYRVEKLIQCPGAGGAATSHQPRRQSVPDCFHSGPLVSFIMAIEANPASEALADPPVTIVSSLSFGQCLQRMNCAIPPFPSSSFSYSWFMVEVRFWREREREIELISPIRLILIVLTPCKCFEQKCKISSTTTCSVSHYY